MKDLEFLKACADIEEALKNQNQECKEHNFVNRGDWFPCGGDTFPGHDAPGPNGDTTIL